MHTSRTVLAALVIGFAAGSAASLQTPAPQNPSALDAPRPIEAGDSLWTEELTWMEVRDAVRAGKTTVIIGTGGVEQNGPYLAGGKHNFVLATVLPEIAKAIGNTLIAPIVKFVPEGRIEPQPAGHMRYPGTISLEPATYEALLTDICRSYKAHGFKDIILVGDSGGNQTGMQNVANALNKKWEAETARIVAEADARRCLASDEMIEGEGCHEPRQGDQASPGMGGLEGLGDQGVHQHAEHRA